MSFYRMKMDKFLYKLLKNSREIDSKTIKLEEKNEYIDDETYEIDMSYWWWGPYHSSDIVLKNQKRKKGQDD